MTKLATLPLDAWPAGDRDAWEQARVHPASPWDEAGRAHGLRPLTLRNYERAHATWLAWLRDAGHLDPAAAPLARVTQDRVIAFVAHMRRLGRANSTIAQTLMNLHSFLALVSSARPPRFLTHPGGRPLSEAFPKARKPEVTVDSRVLLGHARELHDHAMERPGRWAFAKELRDAALMAILHAHAPRVGDLAGMRLGEHLLRGSDGGWLVRFPPETTKGKRLLEFPLAPACVPLLEDYLAQGRPRLPGSDASSALWIRTNGGAMDVVGVTGLVRRRHLEWLGHPYGPHMARKWLTRTARAHGPEAAFDAAAMLGHSPKVALRHYAETVERGAFARHGRHLAALQSRAERRAKLDAIGGRTVLSVSPRDEDRRK